MYKVDLNCDLGESFGNYTIGNDEAIMKYISSANIACGFHAGDPLIMEKTIKLALANEVAIGAHPGFPDLVGFGRRNMQMSTEEIKTIVKYQVSALKGMTEALGGELQHVKPHGALYNQAAVDISTALAIAEAIREIDETLIFMGLANSKMQSAAEQIGLQFASEVFADRAYTDDGLLVARSVQDSVIHDVDICEKRVLNMIMNSKVSSINNADVVLKADSICIHGDNSEAFEFARRLSKSLQENQVQIKGLK